MLPLPLLKWYLNTSVSRNVSVWELEMLLHNPARPGNAEYSTSFSEKSENKETCEASLKPTFQTYPSSVNQPFTTIFFLPSELPTNTV